MSDGNQQSNVHDSSHYIPWDDKVSHIFHADPPGDWRECDRGPDYIRFTDGENHVHMARVKTLTGVHYFVQVPDGLNDHETVHHGRDEAIARNNVYAAMEDE